MANPAQSRMSGDSHREVGLPRDPSTTTSAVRMAPLPVNIPAREHKSVAIDDFETGAGQKRITKLDYYEEIRRKPIKILMTREISQYYGRETYLKITIKEIVIYTLFLIVLSVLVLETPSSQMYTFTSSMANIFIHKKFLPKIKSSFTSAIELTYSDINTVDHIWAYLDQLVTCLEEDQFFPEAGKVQSGDTGSGVHENQLVGVPRLRTVRVTNDSCEVVKEFKNNNPTCFGYFSTATEETKPFGLLAPTAWNYSSAEMTGMHEVYGMVSVYSGGGFYQDCSNSPDMFKSILEQLNKGQWIDLATRAVIVDFTVYNANINLFCNIKLLMEILPCGGVIPSYIIHTLKVIDYKDKSEIVLACFIAFILFFMFYTVEELYEMTYFKWQYIQSFWNFLDVSIVMMCYLVIATNLYLHVTANIQLTRMQNNNAFSNFDQMLYVQIICNVSASVLIFFCWIKILKYVGINHSMYQLEATLRLAYKDIIWYSIIFSTVLFTFVFMAYLLFGNQLEFYYTVTACLWTLLRAGVGDFDYLLLEKTRPFFGPLFFFLSLFFLCNIFAVMYIAILLDRYSQVRTEISIQPVQMKIGDVLQNWIIDIIRTFSIKV